MISVDGGTILLYVLRKFFKNRQSILVISSPVTEIFLAFRFKGQRTIGVEQVLLLIEKIPVKKENLK